MGHGVGHGVGVAAVGAIRLLVKPRVCELPFGCAAGTPPGAARVVFAPPAAPAAGPSRLLEKLVAAPAEVPSTGTRAGAARFTPALPVALLPGTPGVSV